MKERRCPQCGQGLIRLVAKRGRKMRYKNIELSIPSEIEIPTCAHCGEQWMGEDTLNAVDRALEHEYFALLRQRAIQLVARIRREVPIGRLEQAIGVSRGYFSRLQDEGKNPSAQLVGELAMLAKKPKARLRELEAAWEEVARSRKVG